MPVARRNPHSFLGPRTVVHDQNLPPRIVPRMIDEHVSHHVRIARVEKPQMTLDLRRGSQPESRMSPAQGDQTPVIIEHILMVRLEGPVDPVDPVGRVVAVGHAALLVRNISSPAKSEGMPCAVRTTV